MSGWTVDTLKTYVDRRFEDDHRAVQAALAAVNERFVHSRANLALLISVLTLLFLVLNKFGAL